MLEALQIDSLNPMQESALAAIREHEQVLLLSPTGSGKTLGFLLPLAGSVQAGANGVQFLILTPSRELALQIEQVWKKMNTGYKVSCCYGGHDMQTEIQNLAEAPVLLIGTPGRVADHIRRETFSTASITTLVLDEFDKSLALGFEEDMSFILQSLPPVRKKILVSATGSVDVPAFVCVDDRLVVLDYTGKDELQIPLRIVHSPEKDKADTLFRLLCYLGETSAIIFCNHRDAVERTSALLQEKGIDNAAFHGGMEQMQREQTLIRFRNGSVRFLVATDLAARGLDIPEVEHIIHYHLPGTAAEFTHRNGRTARMGASGTAYILLHKEETVPAFAAQATSLALPAKLSIPKPSPWTTVYINGGKKDKLNKVDIVGFLTQRGKLKKEEIGLITVKDYNSFVAVKKSKLKPMLAEVKDQKIKGTKYRIVEARDAVKPVK